MKRIACLFAFLCAGPLVAQDTVAAIKDDLSSLEKTTIDGIIETKGPMPLSEFLGEICSALPTKPSIVFKEGVDKTLVPQMALERVRFGDLLDALERLLALKFEIKNPNPEKGQSSLIIVESTAAELGAGFGTVGGGTDGKPTPPGGGGGGIKNGETGGPPLKPGIQEVPQPGAETGIDPKVITRFVEVPQDGDAFTTSWRTNQSRPDMVTRTYAIGSLIEGGHKAEDIIEAINLVWTTSNAELAKNGTKVAHHEPSRLLIIRAVHSEQDLANEVIQKLDTQLDRQRAQRTLTNRLKIQDEEFAREREHVVELHRIVMDQLKDTHQSETKKMRTRIAELEALLDELRNQVKGGN